MFNQKNIITAIELGTTKISVAMAELTADDELQIIAVASCKSNGAILKGEVIDIKKQQNYYVQLL
jgi:cell division ATPase FtsA